MKKILVLLLAFALILGTIGCGCSKVDEDFQKMADWEKEYKLAHPDATDKEIDQAFNEGMQGLTEWTENYKLANPDATDEEINQAFKDAWGE